MITHTTHTQVCAAPQVHSLTNIPKEIHRLTHSQASFQGERHKCTRPGPSRTPSLPAAPAPGGGANLEPAGTQALEGSAAEGWRGQNPSRSPASELPSRTSCSASGTTHSATGTVSQDCGRLLWAGLLPILQPQAHQGSLGLEVQELGPPSSPLSVFRLQGQGAGAGRVCILRLVFQGSGLGELFSPSLLFFLLSSFPPPLSPHPCISFVLAWRPIPTPHDHPSSLVLAF